MVIIDEVEQCCIWNREQRQGGDSYKETSDNFIPANTNKQRFKSWIIHLRVYKEYFVNLKTYTKTNTTALLNETSLAALFM